MSHSLGHNSLHFRALGINDFEDQFVVNLKKQSGPEAEADEVLLDSHHGDLHDVCGGSLHGRIQRRSLGVVPEYAVRTL